MTDPGHGSVGSFDGNNALLIYRFWSRLIKNIPHAFIEEKMVHQRYVGAVQDAPTKLPK